MKRIKTFQFSKFIVVLIFLHFFQNNAFSQTNIGLNKNVLSTVNFTNLSNINNGNQSDNCTAEVYVSCPFSITIDLGMTFDISSVKIYWTTAICYATSFKFQTSLDNVTYSDYGTPVTSRTSYLASDKISVARSSIRYVRLIINSYTVGPVPLMINEIEVYSSTTFTSGNFTSLYSNGNAYLNRDLTVGRNLGIGTTSPGANLSFASVCDGRNTADGITWYSPTPLNYGIFRTAGAWTSPNFQQLKLNWITGIIIDGGSSYGKSGTVLQPNGGNVLIGKTTQTNNTYKLEVEGKVRATEIVVNSTGADFVFEKNYKHISLTDLEQYVKTNKHLPEIPSASEMQTNGVSLSEMQTRLLQKVEELTLYMIEMKKENDLLKEEINKLKAE